MKHILIISSIDISLIRFRGRLIEMLVDRGYCVAVAAPSFREDFKTRLEELGVTVHKIPVSRGSLNPLKDWQTYNWLLKLMEEQETDIVFPYTIKPVIYASLAAKEHNVAVVSLITGLGYTFSGTTAFRSSIRYFVTYLYRFALADNRALIFQNKDDVRLFRSLRILKPTTPSIVVGGSGVDLDEFCWREPRGQPNLRFAFVARLLKDKGIQLFLNAAMHIKKNWPDAEFHVFGEPQPGSPSSIAASVVEELDKKGVIKFHGRRSDIVDALSEMDVIVCPSWYREGVPRSLLEALSIGLAVISTDTPGCRDTVQDRKNGWLIPPRNQAELNGAISEALENPDRIVEMSRNSRCLAESNFDVKIVNEDIFQVIDSVTSNYSQ